MFEFSETACYNMPAHFGGDEGAPAPAVYHDVTDLKIVYETDPALLSHYVPACFEIVRPVLIVNYQMCRQVDWMSGGGYNLVSIVIPAAFSENDARIEGGYVLVTWENNATPIIRGRETLGYPKIFAQIEDPHRMGNRIFTRAGHEGAAFLTIDLDIEKTMDAGAVAALTRAPIARMSSAGAIFQTSAGRAPRSAIRRSRRRTSRRARDGPARDKCAGRRPTTREIPCRAASSTRWPTFRSLPTSGAG